MRAWIAALFIAATADAAEARTWRVEKDGSGDFMVIQDALDAAAPGDSVLVGPGRYEEFREFTFQPSGPQIMLIMHVQTSGLVVRGVGAGLTTIGPETLISEINGLNPGGLLIELGTQGSIGGFCFENVKFPVSIRHQSEIVDCQVRNMGTNYGLDVIEGDQVIVRNCEFFGPSSLITSTAGVTGLNVLNCVFENLALDTTAIVIGNGASDAYIGNCRITGYAGGVETSLGGTATIEDTIFSQVRIDAIDLSSGAITMRRCRIEAGNRFPLRVNLGRLECYDSIIGGGTLTTIATWGEIYMRNCHLLNAGGLTVDSRGPANEISDLRYNWWGTTDLQLIDSWITEFNPNVIYEPILTSPVPAARESLSSLKARFAPPVAHHEP